MIDIKSTMLLMGSVIVLSLYSEGKSQLVSNLEAGHEQVVVAYGTSLTANGSWVQDINNVLHEKYPGLATVINSGGAGKYSQWGLDNLEKRVIQKNPDTVFIEFSINDCVVRFGLSVDGAKANLETMIDRILLANSDCEIILMTMTVGDKYPEGHKSHRANIEAHYDMVRSVGSERGLLLIDHYPNWKALKSADPERFKNYVPDTIHPTATGCSEVVTPVILSALGLSLATDLPTIGN